MAVTLVFLFGIGYTANATTITFEFNIEFSQGYEPKGDPPWLTATFVDQAEDTVELTMSTSGLVGSEFVTLWDFNFSGDPDDLSITYASGQTASVDTEENFFKADGDGLFDIEFAFPTSENDDRFVAGETSVYTITGTDITTSSFNVFSSPDKPAGGQGAFLSAAHVQGIYNEENPANPNSGWVGAVPIPSAVWLFGSGLLGLIAIRRRKC